jgi:hypothetical protein
MSGEVELLTRLKDQRREDKQFVFGTVKVHHLNKPAQKLSHRAVAPSANCPCAPFFFLAHGNSAT